MAYFISHMTALDFWRRIYSRTRSPGIAESIVPFRNSLGWSQQFDDIKPIWLNDQLTDLEDGKSHFLVCSKEARRNNSSAICHTWTKDLPEGSFYKLSDEVFIASPEFIFLLLAMTCNTAQLAALGYELCGLYSFDPHQEHGFRTREVPLTSISKLSGYLDIAAGSHGVKRAKQALRLVSENSASPMETTCHMLMSFPTAWVATTSRTYY